MKNTNTNRYILGIFLAILGAFGFAVSTIAIKQITRISPMPTAMIAFWRFAVCVPLAGVMLLINGRRAPMTGKQRTSFFSLGILFALAALMASLALGRLTASIYSVVLYAYPSLVVLHAILTRQSVPPLTRYGLPVVMAGLFMVVYRFDQTIKLDAVGMIFTVINALALTAYVIFSRRLFNQQVSRISGTAWMVLGTAATLSLVPFFYGFSLPADLATWFWFVMAGWFGAVLPIACFNTAIQLISAPRTAVIAMLQPVITVFTAMFMFDDVLAPLQWLGAALVIGGILMLQRRKPQETTPTPLPVDALDPADIRQQQ